MSELKFASTDEALQHLANLTGKRVKVAVEEDPQDVVDSAWEACLTEVDAMSGSLKQRGWERDKSGENPEKDGLWTKDVKFPSGEESWYDVFLWSGALETDSGLGVDSKDYLYGMSKADEGIETPARISGNFSPKNTPKENAADYMKVLAKLIDKAEVEIKKIEGK